MKPRIEGTAFGSITIGGHQYHHDVIIRLNGKVKKRKKKLSKASGTSHQLSLDEAVHIYEEGAKQLIVGSGEEGHLKLSEEAREFFERHQCSVDCLTTPEAIMEWNSAKGNVISLFHVTC